MLDKVLDHGVQCAIYGAEAILLFFLLRRGQWRRQIGVFAYVSSLLALDGVLRWTVLFRYGFVSDQYAYCYWITNVLLALGAFLLMCAFFRRACNEQDWRFRRRVLAFVFIVVVLVTSLSLSPHYDSLRQGAYHFIYEFEQNLFFTCLVLNTVLYIMLQRIEVADDNLSLLVCGMGIQFAGPTASLALVNLTNGPVAKGLLSHLEPICTFAMLFIWLYAVTGIRITGRSRVSRLREAVPALAEASGAQ